MNFKGLVERLGGNGPLNGFRTALERPAREIGGLWAMAWTPLVMAVAEAA
jgi:hypothetical protein